MMRSFVSFSPPLVSGSGGDDDDDHVMRIFIIDDDAVVMPTSGRPRYHIISAEHVHVTRYMHVTYANTQCAVCIV